MVLGGSGAVTYAVAGPNSGDEPGADARAERPASVRDLALKADGAAAWELPRTSTGRFSLLGVSWHGSAREPVDTAQVRTRALGSGKWSGWRALETGKTEQREQTGKEAEAGVRVASEPLWVGPSDGVEVRAAAADGSASRELPKGLAVSLVDPGVTSAEAKNPAPDETVPPTPVEETVPPTAPEETGPAPTDPGEPTDAPPSPTAPPSASGRPTAPGGSP
ncbi:N-acetylmuramoyl-L-alanine amidase, partial [Streptomyces sp. G44]|nr:N-acetylmuramoyl-L-alanine amidase [Streptomyces sp. G44]